MLLAVLAGSALPVILFIVLAIFVLIVVASCVTIVPQASAFIVERLGAYSGTWKPVCISVFPFWKRWQIR